MLDSIYYLVDIGCLIFLYHWAVKKDDEDNSDSRNK
jgi:hypothetical protein